MDKHCIMYKIQKGEGKNKLYLYRYNLMQPKIKDKYLTIERKSRYQNVLLEFCFKIIF